jgi:hypothetical protein
MVPVEEQVNVGELAPEPFNSQEWELLSPRTGGLEIEGEGTNVDLTTPFPSDPKEKLRLDQEVPFPEATPVILELGVSPEASDTDRGNWNCLWKTLHACAIWAKNDRFSKMQYSRSPWAA